MNSSEIRIGEQILTVARARTSQDYTPFLVDHLLPRTFVEGLRGGIAEVNPSVAAYGLMIDAAFQSAANDTRRPRGIVSDSPSSLDELSRLLRSSGQMVLEGLHSPAVRGNVVQAFLLSSEVRNIPLEYRSWFQQTSESGIKRVSQAAQGFRAADERYSDLFRRF